MRFIRAYTNLKKYIKLNYINFFLKKRKSYKTPTHPIYAQAHCALRVTLLS